MVRFLLIFSITFFVQCSRAENKTVEWYEPDVPPTFTENSEIEHQGPGNRLTYNNIAVLSGFESRVISASFKRIWYDIAHNDGVCTVAGLRTQENEKLALFANRPIRIHGWRLLAVSEKKREIDEYIDEGGYLDLDKFKKNKTLIGAFIGGFDYPLSIDAFNKEKNGNGLSSDVSRWKNLITLLIKRRVDYIFITAMDLAYIRKVNSDDLSNFEKPLIWYDIEGIPKFIEFWTACSKGVVGREVIDFLNSYYDDQKNWVDYVEPLRSWLTEPGEFYEAVMAPIHR